MGKTLSLFEESKLSLKTIIKLPVGVLYASDTSEFSSHQSLTASTKRTVEVLGTSPSQNANENQPNQTGETRFFTYLSNATAHK